MQSITVDQLNSMYKQSNPNGSYFETCPDGATVRAARVFEQGTGIVRNAYILESTGFKRFFDLRGNIIFAVTEDHPMEI